MERRLIPTWALLLLALLPSAGACSWKGGPFGMGPAPGTWMVRPTGLRVDPTSRLVWQEGAIMLDARLDLRDEADDPVKGVGEWRFELFTTEPGPLPQDKPVLTWTVPMLTLAANREAYDPVRRVYRYLLKLENVTALSQPVELRATFLPVEGELLQANAAVKPGG